MATPRPASLARRALPMLVIAGAAGGLLVKLDNPASSAALPTRAGNAGGATPATEAPADTAAPTEEPASSTATLPRTTPTTAKGSVATPTTSAARPAGPAATATPTAAGSCTGTAVNGPTVNTRWGPVQVAAVFDGANKLCDVKVLQYPSDHSKSVRINQRALPVLRQEVLAAQSTDINIVSGATITSDAYAQSLQAILDNR